MDIKGSTFVVAGGASGLGEATVKMLVHYGALVLILDQNELKGRSVQEDIGSRVWFEKADITSEYQVRKSLERGLDRYGDIHGMINTAGIGHSEKVIKKEGLHSLDVFSEVMQVNLIGSFNLTRLAAEIMKDNEPNEEGEKGVIINTASIAAYEGQAGQAAYSASKGGVVSMTLPLARELADYGIRVMSIAPGLFYTPMLKSLPKKAREYLESQPLFPDRVGAPDEYALLVKSILSNSMLNGETIRLDGAVRLPPK
ncbi:SDR family NAD(P)-dependent oxidoreductase [Salipaludibacillus sp. CUR1]|uniref:SDR family NAD(P)-dependent oxidoreductase n=1 Tax=Salipaludibacillus sp. CUR1 TaxID=2820003 RepID=UPI001E55DA2C|nr:SDR family NAD(P)-dependent oxidoreductase [Salipaludibacillus sp. CUR1]MCE7792622.1 SDR family NAD(P)-dependent oxidoreductase [Salipaludibacillus sp. CUR1]